MNRVWTKIGKIGNRNLWISLTLALAIHLVFILCASALFSGVEVRQPSLRFVKVTLQPIQDEKRAVSEVTPPIKNHVRKPERVEAVREEKRPEPVAPVQSDKDEIKPPVPLPIQRVEREIPAEESKPVSAPQPPALTVVAALGADLSFKKEEDLPLPPPPSHPGPIEHNVISRPVPEEKNEKAHEGGREGHPGKEQEGSGNGRSGNGPGAERSGFSWTDLGSGGSRAGGNSGGGSGNGTGTGSDSSSGFGVGTGTSQRDGHGTGSRKGTGFFAKLFSSSGGSGGGGAGGAPRYAENPKPPYPQEAREKGHQGEVLLRVEVLSNGRVGQIEIKHSSGHEALDRSALATVKQWKFIPAKRGEDAVPSWVSIPIKFQLQ